MDLCESHESESSSSKPATIIIQSNEGSTLSIGEEYIPNSMYTPHALHSGEGEAAYKERLQRGQKKHEIRQQALRNYLQEVARRNTDPSKLRDELYNAIQVHKDNLRERKYTYDKVRDLGSFRKDKIVQQESKPELKIRVLKEEGKKTRKQIKTASLYRRLYQRATDSEKEGIVLRAKKAGFTLDDLTRPKYVPGNEMITRGPRSKGVDQSTKREKDEGRMTFMPQEEATEQELIDEAGLTSLPPDWLSLNFSKRCQ